jgi:hypothetical protein
LPRQRVDPDKVAPTVRAELIRVASELERQGWPERARSDLAAALLPGDRIVRVDALHVVVARPLPGLSFAFWRRER